jgi:DNA-binding XRE family transcriptional regulator
LTPTVWKTGPSGWNRTAKRPFGFPNEVVKANVRGESLIKAWREYLKLTQAELASKAGMKQSSLARLESNTTNPRKSTLLKLAQAMGITVDQLID